MAAPEERAGVLMGLLDLPRARIWTGNISRLGHTLAGDNFINLADALSAGDVVPGDKLVLFSYGYGAHWTAMAVESCACAAAASGASRTTRSTPA